MTEIEKKLAELNGVQEELYAQEVERLIRRRYSVGAELALGRQKDKKPEEFAKYDAYCEECKQQARLEIYGEKTIKEE